jgi:hypothetical protein
MTTNTLTALTARSRTRGITRPQLARLHSRFLPPLVRPYLRPLQAEVAKMIKVLDRSRS